MVQQSSYVSLNIFSRAGAGCGRLAQAEWSADTREFPHWRQFCGSELPASLVPRNEWKRRRGSTPRRRSAGYRSSQWHK